MKKAIGTVLALGVIGLVFLGRGEVLSVFHNKTESTPEYVFTYAENQPEGYPTTRGARKFAESVYERTGGRIKINVFSGGELGDEISVLEQIQFGGVDFARVSIMTMSQEIHKLNVLQLPYIFRDADHMWKVLDGEIGQEFMNSLNGNDVVGLSWYDAGTRNFYNSVRSVERLEDMQGLKIRVAESELMEGMVEALGARTVPMAYSEVYAALETGRIDGAENNWPSYESMSHFEVAKYITVDGHNRIPEIQFASQATWDKLSGDDQKVIMECARDSSLYERSLWADWEKKAEARMLKKGCIVTILSAKEQLRFRTSMMTVYQTYCSDYIDVINKIAQVR